MYYFLIQQIPWKSRSKEMDIVQERLPQSQTPPTKGKFSYLTMGEGGGGGVWGKGGILKFILSNFLCFYNMHPENCMSCDFTFNRCNSLGVASQRNT